MSGEATVFVAQDITGFAVKAIQALADLPADLPAWALIGGVAVSMNLSGLHRPTGDLDSVSIDGDRALEVLVSSGSTTAHNGVTIPVGGAVVEFDVIDVSEGDEGDGSYLAHRLGLDSCTQQNVLVSNYSGEQLAQASVPVASAASLVAMKLHAVGERRSSRPDKRSGDIFDIVRLVLAEGPQTIASDLRHAGCPALCASAARLAELYFDTEAQRSLRWLRADSRAPQMSEIDLDDLADVSQLSTLLLME